MDATELQAIGDTLIQIDEIPEFQSVFTIAANFGVAAGSERAGERLALERGAGFCCVIWEMYSGRVPANRRARLGETVSNVRPGPPVDPRSCTLPPWVSSAYLSRLLSHAKGQSTAMVSNTPVKRTVRRNRRLHLTSGLTELVNQALDFGLPDF